MIRVLLVADARLFRSALATALSHQRGITVAADVTSLDAPSALDDDNPVDLAVVDLDTLGTSAMDALTTITDRHEKCAVVALTAVAASGPLRQALDCRVRAFLSKDCHVDDLVDAVRRVAAGERLIEPDIAAAAFNMPPNPLTARERDVLRLAAEGLPVREIAAALFLTAGTVRTYLSTIMHKVGARSRLDAIRVATRANWL